MINKKFSGYWYSLDLDVSAKGFFHDDANQPVEASKKTEEKTIQSLFVTMFFCGYQSQEMD